MSAPTPAFEHSKRTFLGSDNAPWAAALMAGALLGVSAIVVWLWLSVAPQPPPSTERYFPLYDGAAYIYRVTEPDGTIRYKSRNIARLPSNEDSIGFDVNVFDALLAAADVDLNVITAEEGLEILRGLRRGEVRDVTFDSADVTQEIVTVHMLAQPEGTAQFGLDQIGVVPPIPLVPPTREHTMTGELNRTVGFTFTQSVASPELYASQIGDLNDCVLVTADLKAGDVTSASETRYCAGIGEVLDVTTDAEGTTTSELVAVSIGGLVRGSAPVLPAGGPSATNERVWDAPIEGELVEKLLFDEAPHRREISTHVLPVNGTLLFGTGSGALVAFDRVTQQPSWRFQTGGAIFGTPVVANGIIYFGAADKKVYAIRLSNGAFVWAFPTSDAISAQPLVYNGTVFVPSEDGHLYALDADTGRSRWSLSGAAPFVAPPVVANDKIITSDDDGNVYALNPLTGAVLWKFNAGGAVSGAAAVADGLVYVGALDDTVYALDELTGKEVWKRNLNDVSQFAPVVADGRVYVALPEEVFALDARTGEIVWRHETAPTIYGAPLRMGNQLWYLHSGELVALDAATGAVLERTDLPPTSVDGGVTTDGRELYIGFFDGQLFAYEGVTP